MTEVTERKTILARLRDFIAHIKANKKKLFWWWIGYQTVKGILTTSLIWIPMLYVWLGK